MLAQDSKGEPQKAGDIIKVALKGDPKCRHGLIWRVLKKAVIAAGRDKTVLLNWNKNTEDDLAGVYSLQERYSAQRFQEDRTD